MAVAALILGVTAPIAVPFFGSAADAQVRVGESSAEDCDNEVDVQADQNACAKTLAVSGTADASGEGDTGHGSTDCGRSNGPGPSLVSAGCIAVSGTGDATNSGQCASAFVGVGAGCVAVSGTGNASNAGTVCGEGSGAGAGCVAVSGMGDASNTGNFCGSPYGLGFAVHIGCVAVSGTGNASNAAQECGSAITGLGVGCVALSADGDATNTGGDNSCGTASNGNSVRTDLLVPDGPSVYPPSVGVGCIAVSGTGNASNETGENSCGKTSDRPGLEIAIGCVEIDAGSPVQP